MKKAVSLFLIAAMLVPMSACGGSGTDKNDGEIEVLQKMLVNDFEDSSDMGMLLIGNKLGKVQLQEDPNYVKSGKKSAKVSVTGNAAWGTPFLFQTFDLEDHGEYSDFTKNVKMTVWVYNADEADHNVQTEYSFSQGSLGKTSTKLKAGEWTMLNYEVNRQYLPYNANGDYYPCNGVYFHFDIGDAENPYQLYFDELSLYRTNKGFNKNAMYLDEHEICSFDHDYQHSLLTAANEYPHLLPSLEISQDYAQKEKDFNLKVTCKAGDTPWEAGGGWPGVDINKMILEMFDFTAYDDSDEFCFDVYSPAEDGLDMLWLTFENALQQRFYLGPGMNLVKGEWMTVRLSVAELNANVEQPERYGFCNTKRIVLRWGEFTDKDRVVYLDHFRMELR